MAGIIGFVLIAVFLIGLLRELSLYKKMKSTKLDVKIYLIKSALAFIAIFGFSTLGFIVDHFLLDSNLVIWAARTLGILVAFKIFKDKNSKLRFAIVRQAKINDMKRFHRNHS